MRKKTKHLKCVIYRSGLLVRQFFVIFVKLYVINKMFLLGSNYGRILLMDAAASCKTVQLFRANVHFKIRRLHVADKKACYKNSKDRTVASYESFHEKQKHIGPMGWFLLMIPLSTFLLGTWQVKRRRWKMQLIEDLKAKTSAIPVDLPEDLSELEKMEYYPIKVRGTFLHDKELYMGPRSLVEESTKSLPEGMSTLFSSSRGQPGTLVITPFKLSDRDMTILVNRGWVPKKMKSPAARKEAQVDGEVDLVGIVRAHEDRAPFVPQNNPKSNVWFYRDVKAMCQVTGSDPIFIDATAEDTIPGGPIGGQTRINLRNEHLSYIFTWYTLSGITGYLWHRLYIARKPLL